MFERLDYQVFGGESQENSRIARWKELLTRPSSIMLAIVLVGFAAIVFGFFYLEANSKKALTAQADLELEFKRIPLPDKTTGFEYSASHKMAHSLVSEKFNSSLSYQDLRKFYETHLGKQGWQFVKEEPLYDWSRDLGGKKLSFTKGSYTATLEYQGDRNDFGYSYALNFSWGLY